MRSNENVRGSRHLSPSRKPRTNKRYGELVNLHVLPQIGRVQLTKLTLMDMQDVYTEMLKKGLSPTTVRQVHANPAQGVQNRGWPEPDIPQP